MRDPSGKEYAGLDAVKAKLLADEEMDANWRRLQHVLDDELVRNQESFIFEHDTTGLRALFAREDSTAIAQVRNIYCRIPDSVQRIAALYKEYLLQRAMEIVKRRATTSVAPAGETAASAVPASEATVNADASLVKDLSVLHTWSETFIRNIFLDGLEFKQAAAAAFYIAVNARIDGTKHQR